MSVRPGLETPTKTQMKQDVMASMIALEAWLLGTAFVAHSRSFRLAVQVRAITAGASKFEKPSSPPAGAASLKLPTTAVSKAAAAELSKAPWASLV